MPALLIPIFTIIGTLTLGKIKWGNVSLVDPDKVTLVALALGALLAFVAAMRITKSKITTPVQEGSRLLQAVGWAVILPQMLAKTWRYIREVRRWTSCFRLSRTSATDRVSVRCRYGVLFRHDAIYSRNGKCIRAFAVITGGIGLPLIVQMHGGNPAIMAKTRYVCWILRNAAYSNGKETLISYLRCF